MLDRRIRNLALAIIRRGDQLLLQQGYDTVKQSHYLRPPGGGIEFGESSEQALLRELHEELGTRPHSMRLMGTLESRFHLDGVAGHEIIFIYEVEPDPQLLRGGVPLLVENGVPVPVCWADIRCLPVGWRLVPEELGALLTRDAAQRAWRLASMRPAVEPSYIDPGPLVDNDLSVQLREFTRADAARELAPAYVFDMVHSRTHQRMGAISLRIGNSERLCLYAGHIGYGVDAAYRGHRYAARAVRLLIPLARRHGVNPIWITCNPDNLASRRTCELAGGELIEIVPLPPDTDMYQQGERFKCRYRIRL